MLPDADCCGKEVVVEFELDDGIGEFIGIEPVMGILIEPLLELTDTSIPTFTPLLFVLTIGCTLRVGAGVDPVVVAGVTGVG